jgi:hypothetical protein
LYHRYHAEISLQTGISLLFFVVAIAGSGVLLVVRGLRLWRTIKAVSASLTSSLTSLAEHAAATEARAVAVTGRTERLTGAVADLEESLDRLRILSAAVNDARHTLTGWRGVMPKK